MKTIHRRIMLGAGLLSLSAALATTSFADPNDNDVKRDRRDADHSKRVIIGDQRTPRPTDNSRDHRDNDRDDHRGDHDRDGRDRDNHGDHDRDNHRGDHDRDDHRWDNHDRDEHDQRWHRDHDDDRWKNHDNGRRPNWDHRWDHPYGNDHGRPGYNNGNNNGYRPGYNGGYNGNNGYGQNYSQGQRIEFPGYVVDDVNGGGTFRVRGDNGITYNVQASRGVRLRRGQRVRVSGDWYNGSVRNAGVNFL